MTSSVPLHFFSLLVRSNLSPLFLGLPKLLSAISYCTDTLHLPLAFELEHMPFRLISPECLSDDIPPSAKIDKGTFFSIKLGKENFATTENFIAKWANEKGIPL
jgi:hypothetical protein